MLAANTVLQNRYQIIALLGQGGMGAVYRAYALALGGIVVAIKENVGGDPRQFQQEVTILANLTHPNLTRVLDHFVEPNGAQYLVMEFVDGEDLDALVQRCGALPEAQALPWFDQILDAVAYLHSRGVIHRDIKPANIKISSSGRAVLVDFGIAKVYQPGMMTKTGARAATPGYAAPEQYSGGTDQRSDIFSLGATLYSVLTGSVPPDARSLQTRAATLTPPRVLSPTISDQTERVIMCAVALQADNRFQTADEMRQALRQGALAPRTLPTAYAAPTIVAPQSRVPFKNWIVAGVIGIIVLTGLLGVSGAGIWRWLANSPATSTMTAPSETTTTGDAFVTASAIALTDAVSTTPSANPILQPKIPEPIRTMVPSATLPAQSATARPALRPTDNPAITPQPTLSALPVTTDVTSQESISGNDTGSTIAFCPSGTLVTGGGYASSSSLDVYHSSKEGNGWRVSAKNNSANGVLLNSHAICLSNAGSGAATQEYGTQISVPANGTKDTVIACPSGVVTGGGYSINIGEEVYTQMKSGNGWQAYAYNSTASSLQLSVFAVCLTGTSATTAQSTPAQTFVAAGSDGSATSICSSGIVTGGGFASNSGLSEKVYTSAKATSGQGWQVSLNNRSSDTKLVNSYAICLSISTGHN